MDISIICAMTKNRVIGKNGTIPWHLSADLKNFKRITLGKPIIMGHKTFASILTCLGTPLPGRTSIVLTKSAEFTQFKQVRVARDYSAALALAAEENPEEIFVAGGGQIYQEFLSLASKMYLSIVEGEYQGDTYFPEFYLQDWQEILVQQQPGFLFKILQRL